MLIASGLMWACYTRLHIGAGPILVAFGIGMLLVTLYITTVVPDWSAAGSTATTVAVAFSTCSCPP